MTNSFRTVVTSAVISAALLLAPGSSAYAQDNQTCQPGILAAVNGPHAAQYQELGIALVALPVVPTATLTAHLAAVVDQTSYATLFADAQALAASIPGGRIVITLPDGTVVADTSKVNNTFANFQAKLINENHNSRIAIHTAQHYQCGFGVETKLSSTTGQMEAYVAQRLGPHLDSLGTVRISSAR
jgi:hypothetical protein